MIAPGRHAEFVADMEKVLDVYKRPYDEYFPVVCFDEMPRQLIGELRQPQPMVPGYAQRIDYEYVRNGTCNILMAIEPLGARRIVEVSQTKTAKDWALFTEKLVQAYPKAKKIILIRDNLNTHKAASWYAHFPPKRAKALMDKVEFVYTPKHGSWLNIAEIELNVLAAQCLNRRIAHMNIMEKEVTAWMKYRNTLNKKIDWHFTTEDARIKLKRIYPNLQ